MAEQDTPRTRLARRDLDRKAREMADGQRDPVSEVRRLRGLMRAILSKGPYIFDQRDEAMEDGKPVERGRCFWCGAVVENRQAEARHLDTCAWLALEVEAGEG